MPPAVPKLAQLQIRVTAQQKAGIQRAAKRAGLDMSAYVLSRVTSESALKFQEHIQSLAGPNSPSFGLAELNSLLSELLPAEMWDAVAEPPLPSLSPYLANYVTAMVEYGCNRCEIAPPSWTRLIAPLDEPVFASNLQSLRLHLLTHSPPPFRRRNIFIDSSLGDRV